MTTPAVIFTTSLTPRLQRSHTNLRITGECAGVTSVICCWLVAGQKVIVNVVSPLAYRSGEVN